MSKINGIQAHVSHLSHATLYSQAPENDADTFDLVVSRDFSRCYLVDFNPFHTKTDPLLFSYDELERLPLREPQDPPLLRVIESRCDPRVNQNVPTHFHNMVPYDVLRYQAEHGIENWLEALEKET
jgi:hypothetical protein